MQRKSIMLLQYWNEVKARYPRADDENCFRMTLAVYNAKHNDGADLSDLKDALEEGQK